MTENSKRRRIIEQWLLSNVKTHGLERYDDLHIDKIDEQWKPREVWFDAGIEALQLAVELRDRRALEFTVALGFSLMDGKPLSKFDFKKKYQLMRHVDWSPPSLYLFGRNAEPWTQAGSASASNKVVLQDLRAINGKHPLIAYCCYLEFTQTTELYRSFFLVG
ncbi:MAG: hypothetical protein ACYDD2_05715 [Candidatus Acidiferrales bacterium]